MLPVLKPSPFPFKVYDQKKKKTERKRIYIYIHLAPFVFEEKKSRKKKNKFVIKACSSVRRQSQKSDICKNVQLPFINLSVSIVKMIFNTMDLNEPQCAPLVLTIVPLTITNIFITFIFRILFGFYRFSIDAPDCAKHIHTINHIARRPTDFDLFIS